MSQAMATPESVERVTLGDSGIIQTPTPDVRDILNKLKKLRETCPEVPLSGALPLIFRLKGKPYSIAEGHFPFEHEYATVNIPRRQIDKAGRQVSKSTNKAAGGIIRAASHNYFSLLTVTPLFEQVRKFSNNYVKPFLKESTVRDQLMARGSDQQVLQRTLSNGSTLFYNYATNSADRVRGTPADEMDCDELQDFDMTVLPVIQSCLDASPFKLERYSGTPKTFDNTLEVYWSQSSQGIWHIPCMHMGCGHVNVCCVDGGDLLKMIGDNSRRKDNSVRTLICAKCGGSLDSRMGYYVHTYPERRLTFAGYHMPQVIFPMHYDSPLAWDKILDVAQNKPKYIFFNEVLGESIDTGQKLITVKNLTEAGRGAFIKPSEIKTSDFVQIALGVDWGGKGKEKTTDPDEFISNTCLALAGITADGRVHVTWGYQTPYTADHFAEANMVREAGGVANVNWIAHDYGGAGDVRESILLKMGWPYERVAPMSYVTAAPDRPIVHPNHPNGQGSRVFWGLDKGRSLLLLCELIRAGFIIFPAYDGYMKPLMSDFLNIFEEVKDSPRGKGMRLVHRVLRQHDDFVHAVNFAVMTLYHSTGLWPNAADGWLTLKAEDLIASDGTVEGPRTWLPGDLL
jgi:hypothetical protein